MTIKTSDPAPDFELQDQHENLVTLASFRGRKLLVYFYPRADTPGCTAQSCDVRDRMEDLSQLGVDVVGISPDKPAKQLKFDQNYSLGFPLLADVDHAAAEAYGVWGERSFMGKKYMGINRSAFLIDEQGVIRAAWVPVKPNDTVPNVLKVLNSDG